jgi:uncharacterized protein (DUF2252 family)
MTTLEVWYARMEIESVLQQFASQFSPKRVKRTEKVLAKARTKDSMAAFSKLCQQINGHYEIVDESPLIVPLRVLVPGPEHELTFEWLHKLARSYRTSLDHDRRILLEQFQLADFARKVVGVGSVGTRAWIALFFGRDGQDPLFLQFKEAEASVMEEFLGKSTFRNHGQRVVTGQRLMQASSDIFLGWLRIPESVFGQERDYYVRQLWDAKGSALVDIAPPKTMNVYAQLCARTLARAHARSGDAVAISSYLGTSDRFDRALATFAERYADQNEQDYDALRAAADAGRINVETGQ